jgi:hypothetical protein
MARRKQRECTEGEVSDILKSFAHKLETVPGYEKAFSTIVELAGRRLRSEEPLSEADRERLNMAWAELYLMESRLRFGGGDEV